MTAPDLYRLGNGPPISPLGGKVSGLQWLTEQQVRVPVTYVLPYQAMANLDAGDQAKQQLREALQEVIDPDRLYAVRSAANLEDGQQASFAGQFNSYLNIRGLDNVLAAVEQTNASRTDPVVTSYLNQNGFTGRDVKMAVIIQEMVNPVFSGVAFSRNPVTGFDEIIIEGIPGSGSALLQDGATPLRWVHKWGRWMAQPDEVALDHAIVENLVLETRELARAFGRPVDLEWVFDGEHIYWLQIRPIAKLENINLYSNRISREVLPGIIKPLVWSVNIPGVNSAWCDLFTELIGPNDIDPHALAKAFYYRTYFNMGVIGQIFAALGMPAETLEMMMGLKGGEDRPRFKPGLGVLPHFPRLIRLALDKLRFSRHVEPFLQVNHEAYAEFDLDGVADLSDQELLVDIDRLADLYREIAYFNIVVPLLAMGYETLLRRRLTAIEVTPEAFDLMSGMTEIQAYEPHVHLARLHTAFMQLEPQVQAEIRAADFDHFLNISGISRFQDEVIAFIHQFGHLSDSGNDFTSPPWREDKDFVLQLITNYRDLGEGQERVNRDDLVLGILERPLFNFAYHRARQFRYYREAVSSQYTYGYGLFRIYFLEIGRRFAERAIITEAEDIFYLYLDEVKQALSAGAKAAALMPEVSRRRAEIAATTDVVLPDIIYGDQIPPMETLDQNLTRLTGVPTSRGYYRGPVKVIKSVAEFDRLDAGDVLVIPYSDVAWTPLFSRAGAVIAESGGMLSHSSIVAREYGLPAVVSVNNACRIPDGTIVTVDGLAGVVHLSGRYASSPGDHSRPGSQHVSNGDPPKCP